jgi:hypothetical protein
MLGALIVLVSCGGGGGARGGAPLPTPTFTVGGTVVGLADNVVLTNGRDDVSVSTNGAFRFGTVTHAGDTYSITAKTHPSFPAQDCTVTNDSGVVGASDINNVSVTCTDLPVPVLQAEAGVGRVELTWARPNGAESFKMHIARDRNCSIDITSNAFCIDSTLLNAQPITLTGLHNAQAYFFQLRISQWSTA